MAEEESDTVLLSTKGTPLPVTTKMPNKNPPKVMSKENLQHLQNSRGFTDNDMKYVELKSLIFQFFEVA